MDAKEVIIRSLEQSWAYLTGALEGLTQAEVAWSPNPECNSIAFILWHVTRVEDYFVNRVIRRQDVLYEVEGWREKLGTPPKDTGYEYTAAQLQAWSVPRLEVLRGYSEAVREKTLAFLNSIPSDRLSAPVRPERSTEKIGVMLGRISTEIALHVGQVCYLRGIQRGLNQ